MLQFRSSLRPLIFTLFAAGSVPAQVSITIASNPTGAAFSVGGSNCSPGAYTTPQVLSWIAGTGCTVTFFSPQYPEVGNQYVFAGWQDGGTANPRTITAPAQAATYTANLSISYFLTTVANPAQGGAVSGSGFYAANSTATVTATPASGYRFLSWFGVTNTVAGSTSATVSMDQSKTVTANFTPVVPAPPNNYVVTQILANGSAVAINNFGQVLAHFNGRALLWTPTTAGGSAGSLTDLGTLPGNGTPSVAPSGLNDQGQVVGTITFQPAGGPEAFLWQPTAANATSGSMTAFLGAGSSSPGTTATGINGSGQIIGFSQPFTPFIWTPSSANGTAGTTYNDPPLGIQAIDDFGQVIARLDSTGPQLFTPSAANGSTGSFTAVPNLGGYVNALLAINRSGTIVGQSYFQSGNNVTSRGFVWTPASPNGSVGTTAPLSLPAGFSYSSLTAINTSGQIVGAMSSDTTGTSFLYSGGVFYDLGALPNWPAGAASFRDAGTPNGINDRGQIIVNSNVAAYLLTPQPIPPAPASASPQSGAGSSQTFVFTFTDPRGWQDLGVVNILINNFIDGRSACYLAYAVPSSTLYLVNDAGAAGGPYAGSVTLGNSSTIQNSQCTVSLTSANGSGNTLSLNLNVTFQAAFAGNRILYLAARDAANNSSNWQPMGVWQVPGGSSNTTTAVVAMSPAQGNGLNTTPFTFNFSDARGYLDLGVENILINGALDGRHACYLAYARPFNVLYLVNDTGDGLLPGQSLNTSGTLSNSQCTVAWGSNPVAAGGNNLSLSLSIEFTSGFGPYLVFYLAARDLNEANNTGWQAMGTWTAQ